MDFSLSHLWDSMGPFARFIVVALLAMSMLSLVVTFERWLFLLSSRRRSNDFARVLATALGGPDATVALEAASREASTDMRNALARVVSAGLKAWRAGAVSREEALELTTRALERQALRELHVMRAGFPVLATVATTAPFVGLLGTVVGIVNAFQSISRSGASGLAAVSGGISEALVTTALGLVVAIPAVVAFNVLAAWVDSRAVDLSEACAEVVDALARSGAPRKPGA